MSKNEEQFTRHVQTKARHIANYLNTCTPYERAMILHEAEILWEARRQEVPEHERLSQAEADVLVYVSQWLGQVLHTLSPEARVQLIEFTRDLEAEDRFGRML